MNFFKDNNNNVIAYDDNQVAQGYGSDLKAITESEVKVLTVAETTEDKMISNYKSYYLSIFNAKLEELDYDSLATVTMWKLSDGSKFQAEAKTLCTWYEAIITKNYNILNAISEGLKYNSTWVDITPTKEEYLAELPQYATYEI